MMKRLLLAIGLALAPLVAIAAPENIAIVVATCGSPTVAFLAGRPAPLTVDTTGVLCKSGGGGGGTPGGSNTQVQYNNAGAFGGITGATSNGTTLTLVAPVLGTPASVTLTNATGLPSAGVVGTAAILGANTFTSTQTIVPATEVSPLVLTGGTITTSQPLINSTQTWNAAGVTFTALKLNVTSTASAAASLLMDLQVGGTSQFSVSKVGTLSLPIGTNSLPALTLGLGNTTGVYSQFTNASVDIAIAGTRRISFGQGSITILSDTASYDFGVSDDLKITRDAANTLAQRNGTAAQLFKLYETWTDASNYSRLSIDYGVGSAGFFTIRPEAAGTGSTSRGLLIDGSSAATATGVGRIGLFSNSGGQLISFGYPGSDKWTISTGGHFLAGADNTYDIGASGATRPRNLYVAGNVTVAGNYVGSGSVTMGSTGSLVWTSRGGINTPSDGVLSLLDNAGTSFARLQFGGTTSSFPALKRSAAILVARLADDSADATFQSGQLIVSGIATDATHTDSTVCQDTTTHQFYAGSGTLGICLGTSSVRYKRDVAPLNESCKQLAALDPKTFRYLKGYGDDGAREQRGFLAEDVEGVLPGIVGLDAKGRPNSVDILALVPIIVNCLKEAHL